MTSQRVERTWIRTGGSGANGLNKTLDYGKKKRIHNTKMVSVKNYTFRKSSMVNAAKAAIIGGWQLFGSGIY